MRLYIPIFILLVGILSGFSIAFPTSGEVVYTIDNRSEMNITGTTNVNTFCCKSAERFEAGTVHYSLSGDKRLNIEGGNLKVGISEMDCGNKHITRDFLKTLHADSFPNVLIDITSIDLRGKDSNDPRWSWGIADTEITIAGCTNHKFLDVQYRELPNNTFETRAFTRLCITDYGLKTPKPALGLIKVDDEVDIEIYMLISFKEV